MQQSEYAYGCWRRALRRHAAPRTAFAEVNSDAGLDRRCRPSEWRRQQLIAADKSDKIMPQAQKISGLLGQYVFMQTNYDSNHERAFQVIFGQYLSWFQTFIGDYDGAAASFSIAQPAQDDDGPSPLGGNYTLKPAADVILDMAKSRKAVFFNEAHSAPITRTLTIEMLPKLRELGFNYFAAETLYDTDHDLQKRGYPTPKSGFYVNEPLYGEMVRTALQARLQSHRLRRRERRCRRRTRTRGRRKVCIASVPQGSERTTRRQRGFRARAENRTISAAASSMGEFFKPRFPASIRSPSNRPC